MGLLFLLLRERAKKDLKKKRRFVDRAPGGGEGAQLLRAEWGAIPHFCVILSLLFWRALVCKYKSQ